MALYQVQTGMFVNASDINQLVTILQRPSGSQETGKYYVTASAYTQGASLGAYTNSLSRASIPAGSVAIDTSDQAATNCSSPLADRLSANGFRVSTTSTQAAASVTVGGNYTINY